jgi:hypothetical protein
MGFSGMLHRLSGQFVSGQVVFFAVVYGSDAVSVRCEVVKFGGSLVKIIGHGSLSEMSSQS